MSRLLDTSSPIETTPEPVQTPAPRVDLFALTKALVFTKEAYRTLKNKVRNRRTETMRLADSHETSAMEQAEVFVAAPLSIVRDKALTPWDMMDDEESDGGVAFTEFQARQRRRAA
jgi:hypothetical protein